MPVYNGGEYLSEAIESILNQSYKNIEFIIIDDGSTDNSYEIIMKYVILDNRLKVIKKRKNKGFTGYISNLNQGLRLAKGKYVARMDADDVSIINRLKLQVDYLEKNQDIFLVGSGRILIDSKGKFIGIRMGFSGCDKVGKILPFRGCIVHPSIMFRNEAFVKYRAKMRYCEDYDLFLNLLSKGKRLDNIFFPLIKYRFKEDSLSRSNAYLQKVFSRKAMEFFIERINYGKDHYSKFDPNYFSTSVSESKSEIDYINANFVASNYNLCANLCLSYLKKNHYFNTKILSYFILSKFRLLAYTSKQIVHFLKLVHFYIFC